MIELRRLLSFGDIGSIGSFLAEDLIILSGRIAAMNLLKRRLYHD